MLTQGLANIRNDGNCLVFRDEQGGSRASLSPISQQEVDQALVFEAGKFVKPAAIPGVAVGLFRSGVNGLNCYPAAPE
jgi:hypothetical protein